MARYTHDVIIIGGGAGGLVATVGCSRLGLKTALIERHPHLGGDCLFHGCVPSKTLLKSARIYQQAKECESYGLPALKLPQVDLAAVMARVQRVINHIAAHDSVARFEGYGAEVIQGAARFLSEHQVQIDGGATLSAPRIIIATGSRPAVPPIPGINEVEHITNVDIFSLKKLPQQLTVIGAGPIGIEMGHAFARLGSKVTIVDIAPNIMINDDTDMSAIIRHQLEGCGVQFILDAKVERAETMGSQQRLHLQKDNNPIQLVSDTLLIAAGRRANIEELDLPQAGIKSERGFIVTNSKLQSSAKHILAIGDCNGRMLFTHVAAAEGSVAVRRTALRAGGSMSYRAVPWVTYTDPELASIGYNEQAARGANISYRLIKSNLAANDRAQAEGEPKGHIKMLIDTSDRLLGVQIVGLHAGDLILPALAAVGQKYKVSQLMTPIYPYPTMGEIYKSSVGTYLAPKLFNNTIRGILRLLHGYRGSAGLKQKRD